MQSSISRIFALASLALVLASSNACAASDSASAAALPASTSLWKVASPTRTLYLAGTTLTLTAADLPLPDAISEHFRQSGELILEGDPAPPASPKKLGALIVKLGLLPKGQALPGLLDAPQMDALQGALDMAGMPLARIKPMRPWLAFIMLRKACFATLGIDPRQQVGTILYAKARQRQIPVTPLEPVRDQLRMFAGLPDPRMADWLALRAAELVELPQRRAMVVRAWRNGNTGKLATLSAEQYRGHPELRKLLVTDRNKRWLEVLDARLQAPGEPVFVVVGLGHLLGEDSLLDLLRARGYAVTQL